MLLSLRAQEKACSVSAALEAILGYSQGRQTFTFGLSIRVLAELNIKITSIPDKIRVQIKLCGGHLISS